MGIADRPGSAPDPQLVARIARVWDPNDPLSLSEAAEKVTSAEPVPTGLADEEDAGRYLALRLNPDLLFCTNCEVHYERRAVEVLAFTEHPGGRTGFRHYCPRCEYRLYEKEHNATPIRYKLTK